MAKRRTVDSAKWAAAATSRDLLALLSLEHGSPRSARDRRAVRLLWCAGARQLNGDRDCIVCDATLAVAERFADGNAFLYELDAARLTAKRHWIGGRSDDGQLSCDGGQAAEYACDRRLLTPFFTAPGFVRDIFPDPPLLPVKLPKRWRTTTVTAIARGAYDDRASDRLPVLADALEDADCDSEPLLAHLRGPGPHVRGCWALDAVLGLA